MRPAIKNRFYTTLTLVALWVAGFSLEPADAQEKSKPDGSVVRDSIIIEKVLKAVRSHVLSVTKHRRKPLVVREKRKSRRFIVMNFLGPVTKDKGVYTAQIDVDEYDHKIPRILYADVKATRGRYRVTKIRIGPNHFRDEVKK